MPNSKPSRLLTLTSKAYAGSLQVIKAECLGRVVGLPVRMVVDGPSNRHREPSLVYGALPVIDSVHQQKGHQGVWID